MNAVSVTLCCAASERQVTGCVVLVLESTLSQLSVFLSLLGQVSATMILQGHLLRNLSGVSSASTSCSHIFRSAVEVLGSTREAEPGSRLRSEF